MLTSWMLLTLWMLLPLLLILPLPTTSTLLLPGNAGFIQATSLLRSDGPTTGTNTTTRQTPPPDKHHFQTNTTTITIDPSAASLRFDGHGALSAGGSSRLLIDYANPYRDQILDFLYKPKFGASLQVCKVEIGGDTQATDGTEPSHMHSRNDLNCTRGYEFWLMKEAKLRNPKIVTYGLIWGAPGWINNQTGFYGTDLLEYQLNWLRCARDTHGVDVDWIGLWNERPDDFGFMKQLKKAMVAENISTQIVIGDNRRFNAAAVMQEYGSDPEFLAAFGSCGIHYPCGRVCGEALTKAGKACWASEDLWTQPTWGGSVCWATEFNMNFILSNMTSTLAWATVWSAYPNVDVFEGAGDPISGDGFWGPGLLYAWQPWSGHYAIPKTVWASAHTTQFTEVGWDIPFHGAGYLMSGGSFLTMINPSNASEFTVIIETASAACHRCHGFSWEASVPQMLQLRVPAALLSGTQSLAVWSTNATHSFIQRPKLAPQETVGGMAIFSLEIQPQSLITITSTAGQQKGSFPSIPASAPFPAMYSDDFDGTADEALGKYFADQCGSFQVMPQLAPARGKVLRQQVTMQPGVNSWNGNLLNPVTVIGDANPSTNVFRHTTVSVQVRLPRPRPNASTISALPPPPPPPPPPMFEKHAGFRIFGRGYWQLEGNFTLSEAESRCLAEPKCNAITFESATQPDPAASLHMWLTADTKFFSSADWQTYTLLGPHPTPTPPPPPPPSLSGTWAGLCGRVMAVSQNRMTGGVQLGVCLQLNATSDTSGSSFRLIEDGMRVLASGKLPKSSPLLSWTSLRLEFEGQNVSAFVNNQTVAVAAVKAAGGMIGLTSSWDHVEFDNFSVSSSNSTDTPPLLRNASSCKNASLAGNWLRSNSAGSTLKYTLRQNMSAEMPTYDVSSSSGESSATVVQGEDYVRFSMISPTPLAVFGRVQGGLCDIIRWMPASQPPPPSGNFTCHQWTPIDDARISACEKTGGRRRGCEAAACAAGGNNWTSGRTTGYPGCGTCWCCHPAQGPAADWPTDGAWFKAGPTPAPPPLPQVPARPTQTQLDFQARELTQFMHFSLSTFAPVNCTNGTRCVVREQNCLDASNQGSADGDHVWPTSLFNPDHLDTDQWVATAVEWGAKEICLTAKHTGGFALWPTRVLNNTYNYSVRSSPWKGGQGDVIKEFTDSCRKYDVLPCFYFIADWNCVNARRLDIKTYSNMMMGMVTELLLDYGAISRLWFDVYPGPTNPNWNPGGFPDEYFDLVQHVRAISPSTMVLSGADGCMAGHERGWSPYPLFHGQAVPNSIAGEMCSNAADGLWYRSEEVDFSIQGQSDAWFWHRDVEYTTAKGLWDVYMLTVGRGANLILNIPPNSSGVIPDTFIKETRVLAASIAALSPTRSVASINCTQALSIGYPLILKLPRGAIFDTVVSSENLTAGQLIAGYALELCTDARNCTRLRALGGSVGHKVIDVVGIQTANGSDPALRFTPTMTALPGYDAVHLASIGVYLSVVPPE